MLPPGVPALSVEAGATFGWERYADASVGLDHFGASAPGATVGMAEFGFTAEHVAKGHTPPRPCSVIRRNDVREEHRP